MLKKDIDSSYVLNFASKMDDKMAVSLDSKISSNIRGGSRNFLKGGGGGGGLYTIVVTFNAKNNFIQLFFRKNKKKK